MSNLKEKNVEKKIERELKKQGVPFFKVAGGLFQVSGMCDLLIFNRFTTYALELKSEFKRSKPTPLQILQAQNFTNDLIWIFVDNNNYKWVVDNIVKNNKSVLKHYGQKQLSYWRKYINKHEKTIQLPEASNK